MTLYHAGAPLEWLHLDILGPFVPSQAGNKYILMLVCQITKWIEAYPLQDQKSNKVARVVIDNFISRFGCPLQIHKDQACTNFASSLFRTISELLDIAQRRTTPYHPSSNGQVERYNRSILQIMRCFLKGKNLNWDTELPILTGAMRALPNCTTGLTPNLMMLGQEVRRPLDLVFETENTSTKQKQPHEFALELGKKDFLRYMHSQGK